MNLSEYITLEFGIVPDEVQLLWIREKSQEKSELQERLDNLSVNYIRAERDQQQARMDKLGVPSDCFFEQRVNWVLAELERLKDF